jgi:putative glutamine amidotransferase
MFERRLKIGLSPRILFPVPEQLGFRGKTLQYLEQSMAHWVMHRGVLVFMVPTIEQEGVVRRSDIEVADYVAELDGLVLQGGSDVDPTIYGEEPLRPEWAGDRARDRFEIELLNAFIGAGKPVLGVCRGMQLINVAFGGSLHQDIGLQVTGAIRHVDGDTYDRNAHVIEIVPGSGLATLYPGVDGACVNSLHHQSVKKLGRNIQLEALSESDGVVEAIRWAGPSYVFGVQWHPEFHEAAGMKLLDGTAILDEFIAAARDAAGRERRARASVSVRAR